MLQPTSTRGFSCHTPNDQCSPHSSGLVLKALACFSRRLGQGQARLDIRQTNPENKGTKGYQHQSKACLGHLHLPYVAGRISSHALRSPAQCCYVFGALRQSMCRNAVQRTFRGAQYVLDPGFKCQQPAPSKCNFPRAGHDVYVGGQSP